MCFVCSDILAAILSGLIIGFEINTREVELAPDKRLGKVATMPIQTSPATSLTMFVGLIVGVLIGLPPYSASARFKGALETGNPQTIQAAAYIWPIDPSQMIQIAMTLNDNKIEEKGLRVAIDGPAASGKNTLAKQIAKKYKLLHLDSGKLYRYFALQVHQSKDQKVNYTKLKQALKKLTLKKLKDKRLTTEPVTKIASIISKKKKIRQMLKKVQH